MDRSAELRLQPDAARYTLPCFLEDVVTQHSERTAIRFEGSDLTYSELGQRAQLMARGLVAAGVDKGSRVALLMTNSPDWVVAAFAVALAGGVLVPVNTFAKDDERRHILRHSDASMLLMQPEIAGRDLIAELKGAHQDIATGQPGHIRSPELPSLRRVLVSGLDGPSGALEPLSLLSDLADSAEGVSEELLSALSAEVHPIDDAMIIYTSGTTALPKGVLHSQRAPVIQSWRFAELMELRADDVVLTAQPFFWTAGICMSLGASLAVGAKIVLEETFDAGRALETIEREKVTTVHAWPHQEKSMAEHPTAATRDLSSVLHIEFSSPLAPVVGLKEDEWGTYGAYGMSETFTSVAAITASSPAKLRARTHGRALPGNSIRMVDPADGTELARGEEGEIAVKGLTFMRGYYKVEPELYLDQDGYFHTQDGGFLGDDEYLVWKGRLSGLIKTGGANVSPLEVEEAAGGFPGVKTSACLGLEHPTLGEAIVLCVVANPDASPEPEAIRAHLKERLSAYKVPRVVMLFAGEDVSYTGNQKLQTEPLREAAIHRLAKNGIEIDGYRYSL